MASEKVKGLSIKLSADTTAISSALSEVNKSLNSTQKELNQVDKLLKLDPKNITLLTQKQDLLSKSINDTKTKLQELNKVKELADKDTSVDKNSKQYRDLVQQIEQAKIKLGQFENQSKDVSKALEDNGKKALDFGDLLKAKVIGDAVIGGVKALASAIADIGKGLYNTIRDSGKLADDINTLSKQYNLSTKEIQQYMKASELIDVDVNTIAKSMSKLTKAMVSNSKDTQKAFKTLGVSVKDSNGELRDSNEVFNEVIAKLGEVSNETEQDALALQIFGKSSAELGSLINGGAEQLAEFNKYLEENNLLLSQSELDDLNNMNDAFDTLKATFDSVIQKISAELAPVITPIVQQISNLVIENKDAIIDLVKRFIEYITSEEAKEQFNRIIETIDKTIDFVINEIPNVIKGVKDTIKALEPLAKLINGMLEAARELAQLLSGTYDPSIAINSRANPYTNGRAIGGSGGYGFQSGGFTSNLTINVNTNQMITEQQVRGWANIINEELGGMVNV